MCPGCDENLARLVGRTVYSRATLIEQHGVYDGGLFIAHTRESGGCGYAWHRWPKGHDLHHRAEPFVQEWNERFRKAKIEREQLRKAEQRGKGKA